MNKFTNEQAAKAIGVTVEQVKAGHARNAEECWMQAERARVKGKSNGRTQAEWLAMAAESDARSK